MFTRIFGIGAAVLALLLAVQTARLSHSEVRRKAETARADLNLERGMGWRKVAIDWKAAHSREEAARRKESALAADALQRASQARAATNSNAFDRGYAAGRSLACTGGPNAPVADSPSPGPGRVRVEDDFRANWSAGAYRPR